VVVIANSELHCGYGHALGHSRGENHSGEPKSIAWTVNGRRVGSQRRVSMQCDDFPDLKEQLMQQGKKVTRWLVTCPSFHCDSETSGFSWWERCLSRKQIYCRKDKDSTAFYRLFIKCQYHVWKSEWVPAITIFWNSISTRESCCVRIGQKLFDPRTH